MPDKIAPVQSGPAASARGAARNLQERIASGMVMVFVALALVYAGAVPFAILVVAIGLVMSWEWGHMVRGVWADAGFCAHGSAIGVAVGLVALGDPVRALVALILGAAVVFVMTRATRPELSALGVFYAGLPAIAMVWLRQDETHGFAAIAFLFLIVWTTDTMAFVVGRAVGGWKLWPAISPNKTWSGFVGGIGSAAALSALYAVVIVDAIPWRLGLIGLILGIVAQGGDLAESALKRQFGMKDASNLIPGHGGVMDRMDGIVSAALAAAVIALMTGSKTPASALLIGG